MNYIALQDTKVLEDQEIRRTFYRSGENNPPQRAWSSIIKYTGAVISPRWTDDEPGRAFGFPLYPVKSAQNRADEFQTLCCVEADISSAPYISRTIAGKVSHSRDYEIILLVGFTELKAQVCWKDTAVRVYIIPYVSI